MKKIFTDEKTKNLTISLITAGISIILFYLIIVNITLIKDGIVNFLYVCSPFIWGLIFAFITLPLANKIEKAIGDKLKFKTKRLLTSIICVLIIIAVIVVFFLILIPQLTSSFSELTTVISNYFAAGKTLFESLGTKLNLKSSIIDFLYQYSTKIINGLWTIVEESVPNAFNYLTSFVTNIGNFLMGFIVAIYILIDREHLYTQFTKLFKAFLPNKVFSYLAHVKDLCIDCVGKFFVGKIIDSTIIGILCYLALIIFKVDYALLISFIVGVTNIIPFFGPIIGAIPGIIILLIIDPIQALIFGIIIIVLQQIDGNLIGPSILGNKIGISSLWIMVSIIIGGAYFGFFGMLLGVPVFSIIYQLVKEIVNKKLNKLEEK